MFGLGPMEIAVIVLFALLIFGKRLPSIGKSVGRSMVEFKNGLAGVESQIDKQIPASQPVKVEKLPQYINSKGGQG